MKQPSLANIQPKSMCFRFNIWFFLSLCLLVAIVYPAFLHEYLFHDDWIHYSGKAASCAGFPMHNWFWVLGRPLGHEILCLEYKTIGQISDAHVARIITFVALVGFFIILYVFLRREDIPKSLSSCLALGMAALPGSIISVAWIGAGFVVYSLLFSALSALLCQQALRLGSGRTRTYWALLIFAAVMQIASALIYQIGAMFFLVLVAMFCAIHIGNRQPSTLRDSALLLGVFFVANITYFFGFKALVASELAKLNPERGLLFNDLGGGISWFIEFALPRALNLWLVRPSYGWTFLPFLTALIFIASFILFVFSWPKGSAASRALPLWLYMPAILMLGAATFLPVVVSSFRLEVYRTLLPLSSFVFCVTLIHIWMGMRSVKVKPRAAECLTVSFMVVVALISQRAMYWNIVFPKYAEVQLIKNTMLAAKERGFTSMPVHLIVPAAAQPWKTDEIGALTASFGEDTRAMINVMRREYDLPRVAVSSSAAGEPVDPNGKLVIDLSAIPNIGFAESLQKSFRFNSASLVNIRAQGDRDSTHPSTNAFDGSIAPDDFWETPARPEPRLDIEYGVDTVLIGYQFSAGESFNRMPVAWKLLASSDQKTWTAIDERSGIIGWGVNKAMSFDVPKSGSYRRYRFVFEKALDPEIMRIYEIKLLTRRTH